MHNINSKELQIWFQLRSHFELMLCISPQFSHSELRKKLTEERKHVAKLYGS